ncbi:MAG: hypothetical protein R6U52_01630 [Kosmotogaceae bacterium]
MKVLYGEKIWCFDEELSVEELLEKINIEKEEVIVLANGKKLECNDSISSEASVLIVENARGG